jgi:hypothetical protein
MGEGDQPTPIDDDDLYTLKRYEAFREAAAYMSAAFERVPAVRRVVLFGWGGHGQDPPSVNFAMYAYGFCPLKPSHETFACQFTNAPVGFSFHAHTCRV